MFVHFYTVKCQFKMQKWENLTSMWNHKNYTTVFQNSFIHVVPFLSDQRKHYTKLAQPFLFPSWYMHILWILSTFSLNEDGPKSPSLFSAEVVG